MYNMFLLTCSRLFIIIETTGKYLIKVKSEEMVKSVIEVTLFLTSTHHGGVRVLVLKSSWFKIYTIKIKS